MAEESQLICICRRCDEEECSEGVFTEFHCVQCKKTGTVCEEHAKECYCCEKDICAICFINECERCTYVGSTSGQRCYNKICKNQYCATRMGCDECGETICTKHQLYCEICNLHKLCNNCWEMNHDGHFRCNKSRGTEHHCEDRGESACEYKHRGSLPCDNWMCDDHIFQCHICDKILCDQHTCSSCDKPVCYKHRKVCCKVPVENKKRKRDETEEDLNETPPKKVIDLVDL